MGTAGGSGREHTRANVPQAGQKISQNSYFYSGFTVIRACHRLAFFHFCSENKVKLSTLRSRASPLPVRIHTFARENVGKLETAISLASLRGRVQQSGAPQKCNFHSGKQLKS